MELIDFNLIFSFKIVGLDIDLPTLEQQLSLSNKINCIFNSNHICSKTKCFKKIGQRKFKNSIDIGFHFEGNQILLRLFKSGSAQVSTPHLQPPFDNVDEKINFFCTFMTFELNKQLNSHMAFKDINKNICGLHFKNKFELNIESFLSYISKLQFYKISCIFKRLELIPPESKNKFHIFKHSTIFWIFDIDKYNDDFILIKKIIENFNNGVEIDINFIKKDIEDVFLENNFNDENGYILIKL